MDTHIMSITSILMDFWVLFVCVPSLDSGARTADHWDVTIISEEVSVPIWVGSNCCDAFVHSFNRFEMHKGWDLRWLEAVDYILLKLQLNVTGCLLSSATYADAKDIKTFIIVGSGQHKALHWGLILVNWAAANSDELDWVCAVIDNQLQKEIILIVTLWW